MFSSLERSRSIDREYKGLFSETAGCFTGKDMKFHYQEARALTSADKFAIMGVMHLEEHPDHDVEANDELELQAICGRMISAVPYMLMSILQYGHLPFMFRG